MLSEALSTGTLAGAPPECLVVGPIHPGMAEAVVRKVFGTLTAVAPLDVPVRRRMRRYAFRLVMTSGTIRRVVCEMVPPGFYRPICHIATADWPSSTALWPFVLTANVAMVGQTRAT
jgi:hypothetical protein